MDTNPRRINWTTARDKDGGHRKNGTPSRSDDETNNCSRAISNLGMPYRIVADQLDQGTEKGYFLVRRYNGAGNTRTNSILDCLECLGPIGQDAVSLSCCSSAEPGLNGSIHTTVRLFGSRESMEIQVQHDDGVKHHAAAPGAAHTRTTGGVDIGIRDQEDRAPAFDPHINRARRRSSTKSSGSSGTRGKNDHTGRSSPFEPRSRRRSSAKSSGSSHSGADAAATFNRDRIVRSYQPNCTLQQDADGVAWITPTAGAYIEVNGIRISSRTAVALRSQIIIGFDKIDVFELIGPGSVLCIPPESHPRHLDFLLQGNDPEPYAQLVQSWGPEKRDVLGEQAFITQRLILEMQLLIRRMVAGKVRHRFSLQVGIPGDQVYVVVKQDDAAQSTAEHPRNTVTPRGTKRNRQTTMLWTTETLRNKIGLLVHHTLTTGEDKITMAAFTELMSDIRPSIRTSTIGVSTDDEEKKIDSGFGENEKLSKPKVDMMETAAAFTEIELFSKFYVESFLHIVDDPPQSLSEQIALKKKFCTTGTKFLNAKDAEFLENNLAEALFKRKNKRTKADKSTLIQAGEMFRGVLRKFNVSLQNHGEDGIENKGMEGKSILEVTDYAQKQIEHFSKVMEQQIREIERLKTIIRKRADIRTEEEKPVPKTVPPNFSFPYYVSKNARLSLSKNGAPASSSHDEGDRNDDAPSQSTQAGHCNDELKTSSAPHAVEDVSKKINHNSINDPNVRLSKAVAASAVVAPKTVSPITHMWRIKGTSSPDVLRNEKNIVVKNPAWAPAAVSRSNSLTRVHQMTVNNILSHAKLQQVAHNSSPHHQQAIHHQVAIPFCR